MCYCCKGAMIRSNATGNARRMDFHGIAVICRGFVVISKSQLADVTMLLKTTGEDGWIRKSLHTPTTLVFRYGSQSPILCPHSLPMSEARFRTSPALQSFHPWHKSQATVSIMYNLAIRIYWSSFWNIFFGWRNMFEVEIFSFFGIWWKLTVFFWSPKTENNYQKHSKKWSKSCGGGVKEEYGIFYASLIHANHQPKSCWKCI